MVHYVYTDNGIERLTEAEVNTLFGNALYRSYATQYYQGVITLADVPEAYREAVAACVAARTERWGTYQEQAAKDFEVAVLVGSLVNADLSNGDLDAFSNDVERLRSNATDAVASLAVGVYPHLRGDGNLIPAGTRINWCGVLKRAAVDLWDTPDNAPDVAPALWEEIPYRGGIRIIPDVITAGLAFSKDEQGWWGDVLYRSLVDANVYTPVQYAANWEVVEQ